MSVLTRLSAARAKGESNAITAYDYVYMISRASSLDIIFFRLYRIDCPRLAGPSVDREYVKECLFAIDYRVCFKLQSY